MSRLLLVCCLVLWGCGRAAEKPTESQNQARQAPKRQTKDDLTTLPQADQKLCTAIVLIIDTSGSMKESVKSGEDANQPKHVIARDAVRGIIDFTDNWKAKHTDRELQFGILTFSSKVNTALPMAAFNRTSAEAGLNKIPKPGGGTAIGRAVAEGFKALYKSGCVHKHVVCITDGENTSGPKPQDISQTLFEKTRGEVKLHFVAFDTAASQFQFLKDVNGHVVEAADGPELNKQLTEIYEKRILAEAMPAETE